MKQVQMWTVQEVVDLIKRHSELFPPEPWGSWKVGQWEYWLMKPDEIWVCHPVNTGFDDDEMVVMFEYSHLENEWLMDTHRDDYHAIDKVVEIIKRQVAEHDRKAKLSSGQMELF